MMSSFSLSMVDVLRLCLNPFLAPLRLLLPIGLQPGRSSVHIHAELQLSPYVLVGACEGVVACYRHATFLHYCVWTHGAEELPVTKLSSTTQANVPACIRPGPLARANGRYLSLVSFGVFGTAGQDAPQSIRLFPGCHSWCLAYLRQNCLRCLLATPKPVGVYDFVRIHTFYIRVNRCLPQLLCFSRFTVVAGCPRPISQNEKTVQTEYAYLAAYSAVPLHQKAHDPKIRSFEVSVSHKSGFRKTFVVC